MALVLWRRIKRGKERTEEPQQEGGGWLLRLGRQGWASMKGERTLGVVDAQPGRARRRVGGEVRETAGPGPRGHGCQLRTWTFALRQMRSHGSFVPRTNMI